MAATKYVKAEGVKLQWCKLQESDRDMGPSDGSDVGNKIDEIQGQYLIDIVLTEDQEKALVKAGVPNKGLQAQLFKQRDDGTRYYKAKRGHFNPKFKDNETGDMGVTVGPPKVWKLVDPDGPQVRDNMVAWDFEEDGLIGNGTVATVKFSVWDKKITTLEEVLITEHVPYESTGSEF